MKDTNVLILDDNFIIAREIKERLFYLNRNYKTDYNVGILPMYLEINNNDFEIAATQVNTFLTENDIEYMLLDRGFGSIIDGDDTSIENLEKEFIYKDNRNKIYLIEDLFKELKTLNPNNIEKIKGVVIYTYDDYRHIGKHGNVIKEEIINNISKFLPKKCKIEVLLTYSEIYKKSGIDLYYGYYEEGIIKLGRTKEFVFYGILTGELLYHKLLQIINFKKIRIIKQKRALLYFRLITFYMIFIGLSIGTTALSNFILKDNIIIGFCSILFGILIPLIILKTKPEILLDFNDHDDENYY